ncbi:MAG: dTMP kinase [Corynebacterium sp.]|nr:dTMP kinase [Corynebacterium sp.]
MIVAIEGIDGAGKNTLVSALKAEFDAEVISFPQYELTDAARLVRRALYGQMGDLTESPYAMATLFALDRAAARDRLREAAESTNTLLICDRYVASNAAYTAARLEDMEAAQWIYQLEFAELGLPIPHLQVLLDISTELARSRAVGRASEDPSRTRDTYERDNDLQTRTAQAYQTLARQQWVSPWVVASSSAPSEDVANLVGQEISKILAP